MQKNTPEFFSKYGYYRDMGPSLLEIGNARADSTSTLAGNQIKHLKEALRELISIVEIHTTATGNNFAWAELDEARLALSE